MAHLQAKGGADVTAEPDEFVPDSGIGEAETEPPRPGEIRFYKKTYATPSHDVLVHYKDCKHNRWEGAHSADKAKKGIAKLEGRDNWQNIWHCAACTGGGVWKVRW